MPCSTLFSMKVLPSWPLCLYNFAEYSQQINCAHCVSGVTYQLISMFGPGQVADLRAGVHTLQRLWGEGVPKSDTAVGSAAPRCQQTVLVGGPGNGFHCSQVIHVCLYWAQRGVVPNQQLGWQITAREINTLNKCIKMEAGLITITTLPCCRCHQKRAADGQCSTLSHTLPVCVPAAVSLTGAVGSAHLFEESYDHGSPKTTDPHSTLTLLQTEHSLIYAWSHSQHSTKMHNFFQETTMKNVER